MSSSPDEQAPPFGQRQRRALAAICDTFAPGGDGLPSASELGVPEELEALVARNPRAVERRRLARLLGLWDGLAPAALAGSRGRFSTRSQAERERILLGWGDSRIPVRRTAFHALRRATLLLYYLLPGPGGGPNPAWEEIGYDGPLGPLQPPTPTVPPTAPEPIARDTTLSCDAVVIGSGAGGGAAAAVLAAAGLDVVVLEAGAHLQDGDFAGSERDALLGYYMQAPIASDDGAVNLLAGWCVGGGTVVNYSTALRTPDNVRAQWASLGVSAFADGEYGASLDAVCERIGVTCEYSTPSPRDRVLRDGCERLGWHVDVLPRNVRGCVQGRECGYCGLGCRVGAKQSTAKTWLVDAEAAGARVLAQTRAERVVVRDGEARGVVAWTAGGHRVDISSRVVVAACNAIHTPALLRRSGLHNKNIGRHLRLHPATAVFGEFSEPIKPWEGVMQAVYSDARADLDGGWGVKYETAPLHPHVMVPLAPWRGWAAHLRIMRALPRSVGIIALLRDRDGGEVRVGRDGEPVVRYGLSDYDRGHLRAGVDGAARILEAAGAEAVFSAHTRAPRYVPGSTAAHERFMADCDAAGWDAGRCELSSLHIMCSARMGGSRRDSACDPTGQAWEVRGLYICDGSSLPTAPGVNPMVSIEATAHMNARGIAADLV